MLKKAPCLRTFRPAASRTRRRRKVTSKCSSHIRKTGGRKTNNEEMQLSHLPPPKRTLLAFPPFFLLNVEYFLLLRGWSGGSRAHRDEGYLGEKNKEISWLNGHWGWRRGGRERCVYNNVIQQSYFGTERRFYLRTCRRMLAGDEIPSFIFLTVFVSSPPMELARVNSESMWRKCGRDIIKLHLGRAN